MLNPGETSNATSVDYVSRVNRAIDYVLQNLDGDLSLDAVARAACFSPFHFHRIFRSIIGESLNQFVKRVRLERALVLLSAPTPVAKEPLNLTDIAFACGFSSSSDFSRSFKQRYGVPPSSFDVDAFRRSRREEWQSAIAGSENRHLLDGLEAGENPDGFEVRIRRLSPRCVAYIRVLDPYRENVVQDAADRLLRWADEHRLADGQWLGYQWDDPEIVAHPDCRYDVGLVVPDFNPCDEIGRLDFPAMQVAEVEIRGAIDLEMRALDWLFKTWLPTSGYFPTEHPCFEAWMGRPFTHGMEYFEITIQLPIQR